MVDVESVPCTVVEVKLSQREKLAEKERAGGGVKLGFETSVRTA